MPPNTLLGLLLFLWLVTPGFLCTLLAGRRRAPAKEPAFRETARVVLASVAFSSAGAAVAGAVFVGTGVDVDPERLIAEGRSYVGRHYRAVAAFLGLQIIAVCCLAGLVNLLDILRIRTTTDQALPRLTQESAWDRPLGRCPAGARPQAWVRMASVVELRGIVAGFGHEIDVRERELVLRDPIEIRYPGQTTMQPLSEQRVVVQGADLEFLAVQYNENEDGDAPSPGCRPWPWRRSASNT